VTIGLIRPPVIGIPPFELITHHAAMTLSTASLRSRWILPLAVVLGGSWLAGEESAPPKPEAPLWTAPTEDRLPPEGEERDLILYGKSLISSTAAYLGPQGSVSTTTNGMNCQNCHLDAGGRPWGNNYFGVQSCYPKFRARSGTEETIVKRISDCFERSLNGTAPAPDSREMQALLAYMKWLGTGVAKDQRPPGTGLKTLPYLDRAADPDKGQAVFTAKCIACHGVEGQGLKLEGQTVYQYPPLWGDHSYNDAAGLFRLSSFASYVKANMPFGATIDTPMLTDEEAWDVAAFVNSRPRPHMDQSHDWVDISKKPIDQPFGPYSDHFDETQHKFGPFPPIQADHKATEAAKKAGQ